ncbi:hypothetical protein Gotri_023110 [Gossypium trilobum]|uniref:Uncharacterized protein n=1 Tax=Gossypium trilobum TaxID=34281 RepID=A0A7J9DI71_9ROSI|nr:hypothetical protein [Gossypium trilobum]
MTLKRHSWRFQDLVVPPRRCAEGRKARVSFWDMLMGFSMEVNRSTKALTEEDIELLEGSVYTEIIEVSFWDMLMGFPMEANRSMKALIEEDIELLEGSVYNEKIEGIPLITFIERIHFLIKKSMDQSVTIKLLGRSPSLFLGHVDGISDGSKSFNEGTK